LVKVSKLKMSEVSKKLMGFKFSTGKIYELKYLNVPEDAPKSQKFQWFLEFNETEPKKLSFVSWENDVRTFEDKVILDSKNMKLKVQEEEFNIEND
jgi:hypothetical protein